MTKILQYLISLLFYPIYLFGFCIGEFLFFLALFGVVFEWVTEGKNGLDEWLEMVIGIFQHTILFPINNYKRIFKVKK